jgi:hypothetical protein
MSDAYRRNDDTDAAPLIRDEINALFRGLLRYPGLLREAARANLAEARFYQEELVYFTVFSAAQGLFTEFGALSRDMLVTRIASAIETGSVVISSADADFLFGPQGEDGFIDEAFAAPLPEGAAQAAEKAFLAGVLKRFLNVRLIKPNLQSTFNRSADNTVPVGMQEILTRWGREAQRVANIGLPTANSAAMPSFGTDILLPPPAMTTGIPWIDQYTGGIRPGDIIGVLGPYSGGKTTVLTTAAVRMAELYANQSSNKLSVFVGYEDGAERMNALFWSAAARINRNLFTSAGAAFWEQLSTRETLKDYDRQLPENRNGEIMFGERERWDNALAWFNRHFVFMDFSYNQETGGHGAGGVPEIKSALERLAEERGMEIGFVAIDYAGILVERLLAATGGAAARVDLHAITRPIKQVPDELRSQVAKVFNCTVMLAHQLAPGEVKKSAAYKYISHLDASGSKGFAENVHSCMCINTRDTATLVSTIFWSKIRMGLPPCGSPHGLIRMDDNVVDVHLVNDLYVADVASQAILPRGAVRVASPPPTATASENRRSGWNIDPYANDI